MNRSVYMALMAPAGSPLPERLHAFAREIRGEHGLAVLLEMPGLLVLGDPDAKPLLLNSQPGIIWGHLFQGEQRITDPAEVTDPARLLQDYWGGYVAIYPAAGGFEVLRDPSGAVACYHAEIDGAHLFTSRPDMLFDARLLRPEIDWVIVAQALAFRDLRPARTALRGISELLPGTGARVLRDRVTTRCAWSPWRFTVPCESLLDPAAAIEAVERVTRATIGTWAAAFERPLAEISGGLDSSIVAAAASGRAPELHCLTFGPSSGDPDERPYARAVAAHLGLGLTELALELGAVELDRSDASHLPRPCARFFSQALDRPIQALAASRGADAFLGGAGGDNIFCYLPSVLPVIDRLRHDGFGSGALETVGDIAKLSRTSLWKVLGYTGRRLLRPKATLPTPRANRFLAAGVAGSLAWPAGNPWLEAPSGTPPGKQRQVWSLIAIQNHLEGYGREAIAPYVSPLMSQPVLELCLGIPSWLWCRGGNNRAVAREAYRQHLPSIIVDRRTKGSFDGFVVSLIDSNRTMLRDLLLGGSLASRGLLDIDAVVACLDHGMVDETAVAEFMALVDVEAWARSWLRRADAR